MDIHIVTLKEFHIVGPMITTKIGEDKIPGLWDEFGRRRHEIKNRTDPYFAYGLSEYSPDPRKSFNHIVGFSVQNLDDIPDGMVGRTIPMQQYALFVYTGHRIGEVYEYSDKWFATSEYKWAEAADFELYDNRFVRGDDGKKTISVYIPITKK
ncbi:GyrI-like domain-containing protein [Paenibacillus alkalitolerans]|uniref:GyrI-like domain-containing protein n=1 Tax=Paenibacillus alkalitolerans TaxID=2799335 RepID=UPI0018F5A570|nr:GyrI-like domain-containing protein [Paenibacillus alkalitolerans]